MSTSGRWSSVLTAMRSLERKRMTTCSPVNRATRYSATSATSQSKVKVTTMVKSRATGSQNSGRIFDEGCVKDCGSETSTARTQLQSLELLHSSLVGQPAGHRHKLLLDQRKQLKLTTMDRSWQGGSYRSSST